MADEKKLYDPNDANLDPITGEPGAHPVGTGVGAAGAGAVGAAVGGVIGGPIGAAIGGIVGAVAGGLAGKGAAEKINPTVEDAYWRDNYSSRPYAEQDRSYDDYQPAYRAGYEGYSRHAGMGKTYDEVEPDLRSDYEKSHSGMGLSWDKATHAARDAWNRVEDALPGDDHDHERSGVADTHTVADTTPGTTVRLHEERLVADKHREQVGEVSLGKHVETETARVSVPIEKERVVVERNNAIDGETVISPDEAGFGDQAVRMDLYEEVPDIQKQAFVREEVTVKKVVDREMVNAEEQIRREELDIDTPGNPMIDDRTVSERSDRR